MNRNTVIAFVLVLVLSMNVNQVLAEDKCANLVGAVKSKIVQSDFSPISIMINYPVLLEVGGEELRALDQPSFTYLAKYSFKKDYVHDLERLSPEELMKIWGVSGCENAKVTLRSFALPKSDYERSLAKAGISSRKKFDELVDRFIGAINEKCLSCISGDISYPFVAVERSDKIVRNADDLAHYPQAIFNQELLEGLKSINTNLSGKMSYHGFCLVKECRYWIIENDEGLKLHVVNISADK